MDSISDFLAILGGALLIIAIIFIVWIIFYIVGMWKLFKKAGEPGLKAIIPFYNTYTLTKITNLEWYWFLILLLPTIVSILSIGGIVSFLVNIASLVANICVYYNLSKAFKKQTGWIVLSVFFSWITLPLLGISKKENWNNVALNKNAMFDK